MKVYEGKTGKGRNLVILKDKHINNNINSELWKRPFIDTVVERFSLKIT